MRKIKLLKITKMISIMSILGGVLLGVGEILNISAREYTNAIYSVKVPQVLTDQTSYSINMLMNQTVQSFAELTKAEHNLYIEMESIEHISTLNTFLETLNIENELHFASYEDKENNEIVSVATIVSEEINNIYELIIEYSTFTDNIKGVTLHKVGDVPTDEEELLRCHELANQYVDKYLKMDETANLCYLDLKDEIPFNDCKTLTGENGVNYTYTKYPNGVHVKYADEYDYNNVYRSISPQEESIMLEEVKAGTHQRVLDDALEEDLERVDYPEFDVLLQPLDQFTENDFRLYQSPFNEHFMAYGLIHENDIDTYEVLIELKEGDCAINHLIINAYADNQTNDSEKIMQSMLEEINLMSMSTCIITFETGACMGIESNQLPAEIIEIQNELANVLDQVGLECYNSLKDMVVYYELIMDITDVNGEVTNGDLEYSITGEWLGNKVEMVFDEVYTHPISTVIHTADGTVSIADIDMMSYYDLFNGVYLQAFAGVESSTLKIVSAELEELFYFNGSTKENFVQNLFEQPQIIEDDLNYASIEEMGGIRIELLN